MKHKAMALATGVLFLCPFFLRPAWPQTAQEVHVSGSPNPVGSGARALGMGGAFIGVADDATAASWNPGGLIQLETPEVSIVLSYDRLYEDRSFDQNPGASGRYHVSLEDLNYLSAAYPFNLLGRNMIFSLNYQTLYNFNKRHKYDYTYSSATSTTTETAFATINTTTSLSGPRLTDQDTEGYLKALSPAFSIQVTSSFSLGLTLNYFHPSLGSKWRTKYFDNINGTQDIRIQTTLKIPPYTTTTTTTTYSLSSETHYRDEYEFRTSLNPFNFRENSYHLGFLWNLNRYLTLGGVYKKGYKAQVDYKETYTTRQHMVNVANPADSSTSVTPWTVVADERQELEMPASYGLGLSCRFSDQFSMDLDVYRTEWQNFVMKQADGRKISLITGRHISESDTEPTHQVRLGAEYLFMFQNKYVVPARAGVFYDPEPTEKTPDDFYGFSMGGGLAVGSLVFDMAYQYRWGHHVRKVRLGTEEAYQDVEQHAVYASLIYHF